MANWRYQWHILDEASVLPLLVKHRELALEILTDMSGYATPSWSLYLGGNLTLFKIDPDDLIESPDITAMPNTVVFLNSSLGKFAIIESMGTLFHIVANSMAILISLCWLPMAHAETPQIQSLTEIQKGVSQFLAQQANGILDKGSYEIEVGKLDSRLRLPRCKQTLVCFFPQGSRRLGNVTVGVRCAGTHPWTLYVAAHIRHYRNVVVLAHPLPRGSQLREHDLRMNKRETTTLLSGYVSEINDVLGLRLRRSLPEGHALALRFLEKPKLVRRGQQVTLLANGSGLEVRSTGEALSDGAKGEVIAVKNTRSGTIVEGTVFRDGVVRVSPR